MTPAELREWRHERGLTQEELGDLIGRSWRSVAGYEASTSDAIPLTIERAIAGLGRPTSPTMEHALGCLELGPASATLIGEAILEDGKPRRAHGHQLQLLGGQIAKRLVAAGLAEQMDRGTYRITAAGRRALRTAWASGDQTSPRPLSAGTLRQGRYRGERLARAARA